MKNKMVLSMLLIGTKYDGYYNFSVAGIPYCKTGIYSFQSIIINDRRGNIKIYDSFELESLGLQRTIYVSTNEDNISPVVHSFTTDTNESLVSFSTKKFLKFSTFYVFV